MTQDIGVWEGAKGCNINSGKIQYSNGANLQVQFYKGANNPQFFGVQISK